MWMLVSGVLNIGGRCLHCLQFMSLVTIMGALHFMFAVARMEAPRDGNAYCGTVAELAASMEASWGAEAWAASVP